MFRLRQTPKPRAKDKLLLAVNRQLLSSFPYQPSSSSFRSREVPVLALSPILTLSFGFSSHQDSPLQRLQRQASAVLEAACQATQPNPRPRPQASPGLHSLPLPIPCSSRFKLVAKQFCFKSLGKDQQSIACRAQLWCCASASYEHERNFGRSTIST